MNWNIWVRQTQRWVSIAFTAGVIVNMVAVLQQLPLILLLFTGLYLFVLPYATKWRSVRRAD